MIADIPVDHYYLDIPIDHYYLKPELNIHVHCCHCRLLNTSPPPAAQGNGLCLIPLDQISTHPVPWRPARNNTTYIECHRSPVNECAHMYPARVTLPPPQGADISVTVSHTGDP